MAPQLLVFDFVFALPAYLKRQSNFHAIRKKRVMPFVQCCCDAARGDRAPASTAMQIRRQEIDVLRIDNEQPIVDKSTKSSCFVEKARDYCCIVEKAIEGCPAATMQFDQGGHSSVALVFFRRAS